jgi:hypothetical protein
MSQDEAVPENEPALENEPDRRIGEDDPEYEREREEKRLALLRKSWIARDKIYKELFGEPAWVLPADYKAPSGVIEEETVNPEELSILAYGPDPFRPFWTYVTAGIASPWLQSEPAEVSGFGCELIVKSPADAPWAPQLLRTMAFYIFSHAGTLSPGVRIGLNGPIAVNTDSLIRNAIIWYADEAPDAWYELPSGGFGLFLAIGVTEKECKYAESVEKYGTWCVEQLLRRKGFGQVTDPGRRCTMDDADTPSMISSIKMFADTFRENEPEIMGELGLG